MPALSLFATQTQTIDDDIRQDVIEIRRALPELDYRLSKVYKQARNGLLFCAVYELPGISPDQRQVIGYLRVSMYAQSDGHSLATQARQIIAMAQERGQVVSCFYLDAGISGADNKRPAFQAMMRRAIQGIDCCFDAIYCYDLYRFYRGLNGLSNNFHTLSEHGVELGSVAAKHTDLGARDGKLLLYFKGIIGEMYLDDLSRTVTDNKFSRALKGYSNASLPPFGYCRGNCFQCTDNNGEDYCPRFGAQHDLWRELGDDHKIFVPHPIEQHGFHVASDLYATGRYSDADIARLLNPPRDPDKLTRLTQGPRVTIQELPGSLSIVQLQDETHALQFPDEQLLFFRPKGRIGRPDPHRLVSKDSIRDMLQNPYYAGFVVYRRQQKVKGKRAQEHKRFKMPLSEMNRRQRDGALLKGDHGILLPGLHTPLLTLDRYEQIQRVRGTRGHNPSNAKHTRRTYPLSGVLRCVYCQESFRGTAGNGNVRYYEDTGRVKGTSDCLVRSFRADDGIEDAVSAYVEQLQIPETWFADVLTHLRKGAEWESLRRERLSIRTQLNAAKEMRKQESLSQGELNEIERECARRSRKLRKAMQTGDERYIKLLRDFPRLWKAATPKERKGLLRSIFSVIWVKDDEIVGYEPRDPFVPLLPESESTFVVDQVEQSLDRLA
jgi:DNA invertase Pin-like site-specific DNA recombinase